jgi:hypothetical protein
MTHIPRTWLVLGALAVLVGGQVMPALGQDAPAPEAVVSESEPNNTPATADPIAIGDVVNASIGSQEDVDYFSFLAVAGQHIFAQVRLGALSNSTLTLYGPNGTTVLKFDDDTQPGSPASQLSFIIETSGTYYLKVDNVTDEAGSYVLSLQLASSGQFQTESEPNGSPASADPLTIGQPLRGTITPGSDFDYFTFSLPAGGRFYAYAQTEGSTLGNDANGEDADMALLTSQGVTIESDLDSGPGLSPLIAGAPTGTGGAGFLLRINDPLQTAGVSPYILYTAVYGAAVNESEANGTIATADPGLGLNAGSIGTAGDVDYYSFPAALGDSVFISLDNDPEGDAGLDPLDSRITLIAPDGTTSLIVANNTGTGPEGDEVIVFSPRVAGTHYVCVEDVNGGGGSSYTYNLGISTRAGQVIASADTVGLYNPATGVFFLRNSNTAGPADVTFQYGPAGQGWRPIVGDWNGDGVDTAGLYNPATGFFFLRNTNSAGPADVTFQFGSANVGWTPISGDWNGDGVDTVGLYNPTTGVFFLRNTNSAGPADVTFQFGPAGQGWLPIVGDWDGDGDDTVGLYDPANSVFFLKNTNSSGPADITFQFGNAGSGWRPVAGDYNGDGVETIGLYDPVNSVFFLKNTNSSGPADITFQYGAGGDPLIGDWNGL